tara:strand:- start:107 stop:490 length:384 start_codon:yes stop_codon:yes gene_type:complete
MQRLMLHDVQQDDFVIATFGQKSLCPFIELLPQHLHLGPMQWVGEGNSVAAFAHTGNEMLRIEPRCFPPVDVETLFGDLINVRSNIGSASTTVMEVFVVEIVFDDEEVAKKEFYFMKKDLAVVCAPE